MRIRAINRSIRLLQAETMLTSTIFAMPILNIFYKDEIGMTLAEVGLSQAVFTLALLFVNIPTGWLADRFSRKACNAFGDALSAAAFTYYAFANTFTDIIVAEILIGIGVAFSTGADNGLMKAYAGETGRDYLKLTAQTNQLRPIGEAGAMIIGGIVGAFNPRLAIALTGITYAAGAILSCFLVEAGEHRKSDKHPIKDMLTITHYALRGHKELAWNVMSLATTTNITHAIIWVFTPLLILAGVPAPVIGVAWALNLAAVWLGSFLAERFADRCSEPKQFAVSAIVFGVCSAALLPDINLVTIWFYLGFGFVRGWTSSVIPPIVQRHTPNDIQSTVLSVAGSLRQAMYIPLVWGFVALGDISPQWSIAANLVVFAPILAIIYFKLRKFEKQ